MICDLCGSLHDPTECELFHRLEDEVGGINTVRQHLMSSMIIIVGELARDAECC